MGLGSITVNAIRVLDATLFLQQRNTVRSVDSDLTGWVRRWEVAMLCDIGPRSALRAVDSLQSFGLLESKRRPSINGGGLVIWIRATPLGTALIDARYSSEVAA